MLVAPHRHLLFFAPLALLLACKDEGGVDGPQALSFSGTGSCATGQVSSASFEDALTLEGWVRANPNPLYRQHVLLAWPGAFALFQDPDGTLFFTNGGDDDAGVSGFGDWMDGTLHHVAAQWSDGQSALYLDGERLGTNVLATYGEAPENTVHIGCWPDRDMVHDGIIDEVRVSGVARYDAAGFDPPTAPFTQDADTFLLFHMDEGEGDSTVDAVVGLELSLQKVEWVPFTLGGGVGTTAEGE